MSLNISKRSPPRNLVKAECRLCHRNQSPFLCNLCNVVSYCSREHMLWDREYHGHRSLCRRLNRARVEVSDAETRLAVKLCYDWDDNDGGLTYSPWPWVKPSFQRYMETRRAELDLLMTVETYESYEKALSQVTDMLLLARQDEMELQYLLPLLLVRLGKEQELYNYLKWNATNVEAPYRAYENLESKEVNFFETLDTFCGANAAADPYAVFCVILLKCKIMLDLRKLLEAPQRRDVAQLIHDRVNDPAVFNREWQRRWLYQHTREHVYQLFRWFKESWPGMWPTFLNPQNHLRPGIFGCFDGNDGEIAFVFQKTHSLWKALPDVIAQLREIVLEDQRSHLQNHIDRTRAM